MAMTTTGMGDALYAYIAANDPNFSKLSAGEKDSLKTSLEKLYGAVTAYIQSAAGVIPGTFNTPGGGPVTGLGGIT